MPSIFSTTKETPSASKSGVTSIFGSNPVKQSAQDAPVTPSPAVNNAVEGLFSKIGDKLKIVGGDILGGLSGFYNDVKKTAGTPVINQPGYKESITPPSVINPKALQAPLISSPYTSDQMDQKVSDINDRVTQLVDSKKNLDLTDENAVNQYNAQADQLRKDSTDLGSQVQTYNLAQKVHQIITTPTGYGLLGPTQEQQLESGINLALLAGGITTGATEFALATKSDLLPMIVKGGTNLATGLGIFTGIDKALAGVKENASDSNKLLIYLGELGATGGILHTLNEVTPKLGDKLFQSVSDTYNLPKTIYFNPSEVVKTLGSGEMSDLARALSSEGGGLDVQKVRDAYKNGISIELPGSKITTIAEKPFWTKIKSAFGVEPAGTGSTDTIGSPKIGAESRDSRLLEGPTKESIQEIAENIKSGKPAIESKTPTIKISPKNLSAVSSQFKPKEPTFVPVSQFTESGKPGKFFTTPEGADRGFGGIRKDAQVDTSKLYKGTSSLDYIKENNLLTPDVQKQIDEAENSDNPNMAYKISQDIAEKSLKDKGFLGAHWTEEDELNPTQYQVWDKSAIKYNEKETPSEGRKTLPERPTEPERITEYKNRLKLRGTDPVLVDAIITDKGTRAYGASVGGNITLEKVVEKFTEDHEVFHQVFQNMEKMRLFKNFDKEALFNEARDFYGDLPDSKLEEEMAKDFQQYVNEQETGKSTSFFGKIAEFFQKLFASFKRMFSNENNIKEFYRSVYEDKAVEPTEINNEMPEAFEQQVKDGVVDFRIQNAVANFLDEVPVKDAFTDSGDLTLKTIQKLQGRTTVSKQYIYDLTNSGDIKQVERDLIRSVLDSLPDDQKVDVAQFVQDVKDELLPLEIYDSSEEKSIDMDTSRYENVTLPKDLRGNVANYSEHIYESPIKTSAGNIHFGDEIENYFGHTRIEDMETPNGDKLLEDYAKGKITKEELNKLEKNIQSTRRVIEVQSDLYQKGNLEREEQRDLVNENREGDVQTEGFKKLKQYNDPTAHFRMVREEIRKAAQDGKTKLQFPTGETAMKIEGLGQTNNWLTGSGMASSELKPESLEIGQEIYQGHDDWVSGNNGWIITDVLGDGKFKAVPLQRISHVQGDSGMSIEDALKDRNVRNYSEEFDISGKIDTSNPIYKFYEKDLGRYLKNNYNAIPVTDDKGVTWMEVPIQKAYSDLPVPAFNEKPETQSVEQLQKQRERFQQSLDAFKENPQAHMQAYGEDRSQMYKDKIEELTKRIQQIKNPIINTGNKLEDLRAILQHTEQRTGTTPLPPQIQRLQEKLKDITPDAQIPRIHVSGKDIQLPENLSRRQLSLEMERENLDNSPYKNLLPYIAKSGEFKGRLPEVLGKNKAELKGTSYDKITSPNVLKFIQDGDQIIQTFFGQNADSEDIRSGMEDYLKRISDAKAESAQLRKDISLYVKEEKDNIALDRLSKKELTEQEKKDLKIKEAESLANWKNLFKTYAQEAGLPQSISEVEPPPVRGGVVSPELDFTKWKDKATPLLARDTFERNLEKVAPKSDADALKKFIVEPVRKNELDRVEFNNKLRLEIKDKLKKWKIRAGTDASSLIQKFGEKKISLEELQRLSPKKWVEIQDAAGYFKNLYDYLIDKKWNPNRVKFNYPEIKKRTDFFRHFDEIGFFTKAYGFLRSQDELPTEIAGKTEFFKPGKPFSTAEMSRTGDKTKYDAIRGFDNYLDSVSKQIFHIDSIQRGRALEKYIDKVAETGRRLGEPLMLSNFVANLREYINNGLAGKTATLDRAIEGSVGRPALQAFERISKLIGKNIIVGNLSTALSHLVSLPLIGATTDKIPLTKGLMTTLTSPLKKGSFTTIDGQKSSYLIRRFPIEEISPSIPKTTEKALSYIFTTTDKFKSRLAVSGKYYEGIRNGLSPEEAMKEADIYAGKVLGDYSLGQKPNLMNTKTLSLIAQFQLGLNDSMSVLFHDIPESETEEKEDEYGNTYRTTKKWAVVSKLIQFAIFSYLFNLVIKNIRGSGKGIDPIDLGLTLSGLNDEGAGQSFPKRAGLAGTDVLGELPFTSAVTGNFPLATAISDPIKNLLAGNYAKAAEGIAAEFASPVGGGLQAKKTIEGAQSINKGQSVGAGQDIKSLIFGASSSVNPNNAVSLKLNTKIKTAQNKVDALDPGMVEKVQGIYNQAKDAGFSSSTAQSLVDGLTDNEYTAYKDIKAVDQAKDAATIESKILPIVQKASLLGFDTPEAAKYISDTFPDTPQGDKDYAAYQSIKGSLFGSNAPSEATPTANGTWDKQSFITHISNIAKATFTDPVTLFNDVFAGNSSWKVVGFKNGQIIVQRMDEQTSQSIKKSQGGATKEYKLDHIIPLEVGGNNGKDNLQLIPTDQWSKNTPVEDYLGKALQNNQITGSKAREYAIRFKASQKETLSPTLQKEYKDKYNSQPITFDQIKQEVVK